MKKAVVPAILVAGVLLAVSVIAEAQQPAKIPQIGYLTGFGNAKAPGPQIDAFRQGLRELGYVEGKNIVVEYRYIEGIQDRVRAYVAELVQLKVDALVIPHTGAIFQAKQTTKTIPIVIVTTIDPVANGVVDSLARPGGNITGLARLTRELGEKGWRFSKKSSRNYRASVFSGLATTKVRRTVLKNIRLLRPH
jgi:putative ABC transport system substrate-binding protein